MQALWSRAARNPVACRCLQCASSTSLAARRLRATAVGAFPTTTFGYTLVFAAGLAVDGRAKRRRNERWDQAFALLRDELAHCDPNDPNDPNEAALTPAYEVLADDESICANADLVPLDQIWDGTPDWAFLFRNGTELVDDSVFEKRLLGAADDLVVGTGDRWDLLDVDSRFPGTQALDWPANTGFDLVRHHLPPQSLWSFDHVREKALRKRQTLKKLAIQEASIGMLVLSLMGPARSLQLPGDDGLRLAPMLRQAHGYGDLEVQALRYEMAAAIHRLESADATADDQVLAIKSSMTSYIMPQYFQDNDGDFYNVTQQMNEAIRDIFDQPSNRPGQNGHSEAHAMALARIAHNLLVSSAAPDLQTFNLLISGLKRWACDSLTNEVILTLEKCKIRPNEITCAAILDHYIQTNDSWRFQVFVEKMRGVNNALMMANPTINVNEAGAARLLRKNERKVYQKVHPTPMLFNTIIFGVLKFAELDRAMEIYFEMKEDGWGLGLVGLTKLLSHCIPQSDWHNALYIWEEICLIKNRAKPYHMAIAYSNMLSLCSVTGHTVAFNKILNEVAKSRLNKKDILDAAMRLTRNMKSRKLQMSSRTDGSVGLAPSFAADNVRIATPAFANEGDQVDLADLAGSVAKLDRVAPGHIPDIPTPPPRKTSTSTSPVPEKTAKVPWSTWVQSKLGIFQALQKKTEKDSAAPATQPAPQAPEEKNPDDAWAAWLEHELALYSGSASDTLLPENPAQVAPKECIDFTPTPIPQSSPPTPDTAPKENPEDPWQIWLERELALHSRRKQAPETSVLAEQKQVASESLKEDVLVPIIPQLSIPATGDSEAEIMQLDLWSDFLGPGPVESGTHNDPPSETLVVSVNADPVAEIMEVDPWSDILGTELRKSRGHHDPALETLVETKREKKKKRPSLSVRKRLLKRKEAQEAQEGEESRENIPQGTIPAGPVAADRQQEL